MPFSFHSSSVIQVGFLWEPSHSRETNPAPQGALDKKAGTAVGGSKGLSFDHSCSSYLLQKAAAATQRFIPLLENTRNRQR